MAVGEAARLCAVPAGPEHPGLDSELGGADSQAQTHFGIAVWLTGVQHSAVLLCWLKS